MLLKGVHHILTCYRFEQQQKKPTHPSLLPSFSLPPLWRVKLAENSLDSKLFSTFYPLWDGETASYKNPTGMLFFGAFQYLKLSRASSVCEIFALILLDITE